MIIRNVVADADFHDKPENYETGVLYHDPESDQYFIKDIVHIDPNNTISYMVCLGKHTVDLIKTQLDENTKLLMRIDFMKDQQDDRCGYNSMKAQMWCDTAREKGVDAANEALKGFELKFQAR